MTRLGELEHKLWRYDQHRDEFDKMLAGECYRRLARATHPVEFTLYVIELRAQFGDFINEFLDRMEAVSDDPAEPPGGVVVGLGRDALHLEAVRDHRIASKLGALFRRCQEISLCRHGAESTERGRDAG